MSELISKKEYKKRGEMIAVMELGTAEREARAAAADWSLDFHEFPFPGCDRLGLNPDVPHDKNLAIAIGFAVYNLQPELSIMFMYGIVTPEGLSALKHLATAKKIAAQNFGGIDTL